MPRTLTTILLLLASNSFMTFAWYYHVQKRAWPLLTAIAVSWLIALPEYILQVPANRAGHADFGGPFTLPQLKILQEAITLVVFTLFTIFVAKNEKLRVNDAAAFLLVLAAVAVSMMGRRSAAPSTLSEPNPSARPPAAASQPPPPGTRTP